MFARLIIILYLNIALLLMSCDSNPNNKTTNSKIDFDTTTEPKKDTQLNKFQDLNGIYKFKKGMTFKEVVDILNETGNKFERLQENLLFGFNYALHSESDVEKCLDIKVLKIINLNFAGLAFDSCNIGFYKDTVAYFTARISSKNEKYYLVNHNDANFRKLWKEYNSNYNSDWAKAYNLNLDLYDRITKKYGPPSEKIFGDIHNPEIEKTKDEERQRYELDWYSHDSTVSYSLMFKQYDNNNATNFNEINLTRNESAEIFLGLKEISQEYHEVKAIFEVFFDKAQLPKIYSCVKKIQEDEIKIRKDSIDPLLKQF
jgi:hypothetical protein